ncbi:MAG: DMT family transporter [Actinomycetota bacterium]
MTAAIVLAAVAGAGWALNIVIVRWGLDRTGASPTVGAFVGVSVAAAVAAVVAVLAGHSLPAWDDVWRFALVGAIAPGSSQGLFVAAIGRIGPSRTSVLVGTSPAWSVVLAVAFLDETWELAIVAGTRVTIAGSALIGWEPGLRGRRLGVVLALATALSFGVRDVVAREFGSSSSVSSWWAGAIVLVAAAAVLGVQSRVTAGRDLLGECRRALPAFAVSGLVIGCALPLLLEALDRGRVGIVAPLSLASQNITVVVVGSIVFGVNERAGRVVGAVALILLGAVLVGSAA